MASKRTNKNTGLQRLPKNSFVGVVAVVVAVVAVAGYAVVKSSHAATAKIKICTAPPFNQGCLMANGPGKIVTVGQQAQAIWTQIPVGSAGATGYEFQNASGRCLTVNNTVNPDNSHDVIMDPGACQPQNNNEIWTLSSQSTQTTLTNHSFACKLTTPTGFFTDGNAYCGSGMYWELYGYSG